MMVSASLETDRETTPNGVSMPRGKSNAPHPVLAELDAGGGRPARTGDPTADLARYIQHHAFLRPASCIQPAPGLAGVLQLCSGFALGFAPVLLQY